MPESLNQAFEALRDWLSGAVGAVADSPAWSALWKMASTPQGTALVVTVFVALGLGILVGYLWGRPRPTAPAVEPAAAAPPADPRPGETRPAPSLPEVRLSADASAAALRDTLAGRGFAADAVAARVAAFVAGLPATGSTLGTLQAEDAETAPLIGAAARALDGGDLDAAVRNLDLARGRFDILGRAQAKRAGGLRLASVAAATVAGDLEMSRCNYTAAAALYGRGLGLLQRTDGERIMPLLAKRATALFRAGAGADADALLQRAVRIAEESFGKDHPETAKALSRLAFVRFATGKAGDADRLYRRALAIDEKALGADHPDVATDLNNLAQLILRSENRAAAEPLFRRTLAIRQKALGPAHPDTVGVTRAYAELLRQLNRAAEADRLLAGATTIGRQAQPVAG